MEIVLAGITTGILARSVSQLVWVAALCGLVLHALPRIAKSLRDIRVYRSASEADKAEARAVGINVDAAARLTPGYAIIVHSMIGMAGTVGVALVTMLVRWLLN